MGCSVRQVQDDLRRLAADTLGGSPAWFFQNYHSIVFLKPSRHRSGRCGQPRFYVVSRHRLHQVSGQTTGKARGHWREKEVGDWYARLDRIFEMAEAMVLRGSKEGDDKHKGLPSSLEQGGAQKARPPPLKQKNSPALRRINDQALGITLRFRRLPGAPGTAIKSWARNRLLDCHSVDRIEACLRHALDVYRAGVAGGRWKPENPHSWLLGVAERHLDRDGLAVCQRRWKRKQAASPPAFKDGDDDYVLVNDINEKYVGNPRNFVSAPEPVTPEKIAREKAYYQRMAKEEIRIDAQGNRWAVNGWGDWRKL
jgi:hypothetical protein